MNKCGVLGRSGVTNCKRPVVINWNLAPITYHVAISIGKFGLQSGSWFNFQGLNELQQFGKVGNEFDGKLLGEKAC